MDAARREVRSSGRATSREPHPRRAGATTVPRDHATAHARRFHALSDATRIQVLGVLVSAAREMAVGEIVDALPVVQSTVSEHLRVLAEVGFVRVRRDGPRRLYRVDERSLAGFPRPADVVAGRAARTTVTGAPASSIGAPAMAPPPGSAHTIVPMRAGDWPAVRRVYEEGLATRDASFATAAPSWAVWDASHLAAPRLVACLDGAIAGWAALSPVSLRCVYAGVAEDSVYVAADARGRGVGRALLARLVAGAEDAGIWTVQAGIFPENRASIAVHEACGFRRVGVRERLGVLDGTWRDVVLLERRSRVSGIQ